jgi:hypothetical protein
MGGSVAVGMTTGCGGAVARVAENYMRRRRDFYRRQTADGGEEWL